MKLLWKPLLIGFVDAYAREQDAEVIKRVVMPAAENIVALFGRPEEAPPLTEADVRAALQQARLPWQQVAGTARQEIGG